MSQQKTTYPTPRFVYVDIFETSYFGEGGKVGFSIDDSEGVLPIETYDSWSSTKAFLDEFPDEEALRGFLANETRYRDLILSGYASVRYRGTDIWRVTRLRKSFKDKRLEDAQLDELVNDLKSGEATSINNLGLSEQIRYLAQNGFEVVEEVEL